MDTTRPSAPTVRNTLQLVSPVNLPAVPGVARHPDAGIATNTKNISFSEDRVGCCRIERVVARLVSTGKVGDRETIVTEQVERWTTA